MWDKPRCCGTSELHQRGSKFSESKAGSHTNSLPFAVLNLCFRFTLDLHNISFSQSLIVRRRFVYEKIKHDIGMTCPKASTPGPAHSRAGLSKHSHTASRAGLGVAEPPSPKALGIYWTWAETTQSAVITFPQPLVLQICLWDIRWTEVVSSSVSIHPNSLQFWKTDQDLCQVVAHVSSTTDHYQHSQSTLQKRQHFPWILD